MKKTIEYCDCCGKECDLHYSLNLNGTPPGMGNLWASPTVKPGYGSWDEEHLTWTIDLCDECYEKMLVVVNARCHNEHIGRRLKL